MQRHRWRFHSSPAFHPLPRQDRTHHNKSSLLATFPHSGDHSETCSSSIKNSFTMGFSSKIISGLRSMSMSAKQTPPTPSDSIPPTPKIPQDTIEITAISIEPLPTGSKRWSRNFTSTTKPIPRPMIAPISRSFPSPAKATVAVTPPLTADLSNLVKVFQFVEEK